MMTKKDYAMLLYLLAKYNNCRELTFKKNIEAYEIVVTGVCLELARKSGDLTIVRSLVAKMGVTQ